jgi:hypothetical protein
VFGGESPDAIEKGVWMIGAADTPARGRLLSGLLGGAVGLIVGAGLASAVLLIVLRSPERLRGGDQEAAPRDSPPAHTRLPTEEVLECLEGKPLPLPDVLNGGGKAGTNPVIQRRGVRQFTWESTISRDGSKEESHHYALLYDAGEARYFAEVHIDVRQVGEQRAYLGVQLTGVRKVEKIIDTRPR